MSDETATIDAPETPATVAPENPTPPAPDDAEQKPPAEKEQPWKRQTVPLKALQEEREQKRALREERDFYKAQFEASKSGGATQAPEQPRQPDLSKPLNPNDFQSAEEFAAALEDRATQKAIAKIREETQGANHSQAVERVTKEYAQRIHGSVERHPDIVERAQYLDEVVAGRIHPDIGLELVSNPLAADLVVELTNNPDSLRAILDPNPIRAAKALAGIESRISSQTAPTNDQPAPEGRPAITPTPRISGGSAPRPKDLNDPNLSSEEFSKLWDAQRTNRRKR